MAIFALSIHFTENRMWPVKQKYNVPCILTYKSILMILFNKFKGHRRQAFFYL